MLFFVHRGPIPGYLVAAIFQARHADVNHPIVLLTDQEASAIPGPVVRNVTVASLRDFSDGAIACDTAYRGRNAKDYDREIMNFQRWFYTLEYCQREGISGPIAQLDSDSFLFLSPSLVSSSVKAPHTLCDRVGPQFSFFQSPHYLQEFCEFILSKLGSPQGFQELSDYVENFSGPGLPYPSDMACLGLFASTHPTEDIGDPLRPDFMFCENVGSPQGMKMGLLGKKVRLTQKGRMFVRENGTTIRAGGVHLQGGNKATWPFHVWPQVHVAMIRETPGIYFSSLGPAFKKVATVISLKAAAGLRRALSKR
jgi:hypothetical protein